MTEWIKQDGDEVWIRGIYKIVRYDRDSQNYLRPTFRAYYIRKGDKNWGYYVDQHTPFYPSLKDAQAACVKHEQALQGVLNL